MSGQDDVLVIGGGVIGVCSAYYLAEAGRRVTLVDRRGVCSGASWGNAGFVCASHTIPQAAPGVIGQALRWMFDPTSPLYIKPRLDLDLLAWLAHFAMACNRRQMKRTMRLLRQLAGASLDLYEQFAAMDGLTFGIWHSGLLLAYRTEKGLQAGIGEARLIQELGIRATVLDRRQLQDHLGDVETTAAGGVLFPDDAHVDPGEFVRGLADLLERKGVDVRPSTEVLGWETSGRTVTAVHTTRGVLRPRETILAAGAWSPALVRELGIKLPIQPAKGYGITFERPATCPPVPMLLGESKVAVTPLAETLRFGGTLELAGMDLSINRPRVEAILRAVRTYLPGLADSALIEIWRGLRPNTPDALPLIGRCRAFENLIVAAGHGTLGITLGPGTGKLVSQIVTHQTPLMDPTPLSVERFG